MIDITQFNNLSNNEIENIMEELYNIYSHRVFIDKSKTFDKIEFNKKYKELINNTPTSFPCPNGVINLRKETVKNIIVTIKHLTQELDVFMLFVGKEGSGKSLFVRQINYVYWYLMKQFGLIDYDFNIDLVHFGTIDLLEDRREYDSQSLFYRISILDESKDDLGRDKHATPEAKDYIDYMRRCREESGIHSLLMPQLSEFMPKITLSRAVFIFEVDYSVDSYSGDIVRGDYNLYIIPRGKSGHSYFHNKEIPTSKIKSELADYLYTTKRQFESLPSKILFIKGRFNSIDPINSREYKRKKRDKKWERIKRQEQNIKEITRLRILANDYRSLILSLKAQGESNSSIGERIGKSEASIRNQLKIIESTQSQNEKHS